MAMGSKAFESPLISHARMRAMFRGLVELRGLAARRKKHQFGGVEACWVATAIDLKDGDLALDAGGVGEPAMLDHLRAVGRREAAEAISGGELKKTWRRLEAEKANAFPGSAAERLLCAAGAAMALKSAGASTVAMAYAHLDELSPAEWKRVLAVVGQEGLPLVLTVLPASKSAVDLEAIALKAAATPELRVPVIPVDAGDVVAIYRVAQETLVRARAGGGAAVILGVLCGTDAAKAMGAQLVKKKICTEHWVEGVAIRLKKLMADV